MSQRRILVVDDQESMRMLVCGALRALGYTQIVAAANGKDALKAMRERTIDLVLMDVEMPVLNGFETLKAMREDPALARIPVVMVTSRADSAFVSSIKPLNVSGYLVKPVTGAALKMCIDRVPARGGAAA
jgi:two-component system, chemotaxis family, chemotaxis protein CheY